VQQVVYRANVRRKRGQWRVSVPALPGDAPVVVTRQLGNAAPLLIEQVAEYLGVSNALVEVEIEQPRPRKRRRAVPAPVVQVLGGLGALAGVYLLVGVAVTLITAGVAVAALATLRESGRI
jgi:hypothetical protein